MLAISVGDAVSDERIVATDRNKGSATYIMLMVCRQLTFTIKAIGDPEKLEHSLEMINGVADSLREYISVTIKQSDEVFIPKIRDDGSVIKTDLLTPVTPK